MPFKNLQAGWIDKFNAIADAEQDETPIDLVNAFDEDEWTWRVTLTLAKFFKRFQCFSSIH